MRVNADFNSTASVDGEGARWIPSPLPGVERCLLDRVGEEVARATTLVRFAPQSGFDAHRHGGGEEFLVLEGVFSDPDGDFGPGSYVRNPAGTEHAPWSEPGCVIFVKLWQFQEGDDARVRIDTESSPWRPGLLDGVREQCLHRYEGESVDLMLFDREAVVAWGEEEKGVELLVLEGELEAAGRKRTRWSWLRHPPGESLSVTGTAGTRVWVKRGHLAPPIGV